MSRTRHVGVLVPWANAVVESELPRLLGQMTVAHYARLVPPSRTTALDGGFLQGLHDAVPAALDSLSRLPLDMTLLACTSAGFGLPSPDGQSGMVTAFDAVCAALHDLGATRVGLATPYPDAVTQTEVDALAARGVTVTAAACLGRDDRYHEVTGEQILRLVRQVTAGADAVVLSCTNWSTLDVIERVWHDECVNVVSSNLALAGLGLAAWTVRSAGQATGTGERLSP